MGMGKPQHSAIPMLGYMHTLYSPIRPSVNNGDTRCVHADALMRNVSGMSLNPGNLQDLLVARGVTMMDVGSAAGGNNRSSAVGGGLLQQGDGHQQAWPGAVPKEGEGWH
eukprot:CAMPEP_0117676052 /NCGR_PEP_ID=MMETSP0804-20121206/15943_1 /TAXON_ID=1074897 /ORGANISM="Tetraselmis astigmatica, Strain CCMP880" /LENGTH=109 /DNA_ID=CAMNT_0005485117 /DNA_START=30 /DNA_END=359 /DNA_ORIENTATION=+